jgi:hypothetical protein
MGSFYPDLPDLHLCGVGADLHFVAFPSGSSSNTSEELLIVLEHIVV